MFFKKNCKNKLNISKLNPFNNNHQKKVIKKVVVFSTISGVLSALATRFLSKKENRDTVGGHAKAIGSKVQTIANDVNSKTNTFTDKIRTSLKEMVDKGKDVKNTVVEKTVEKAEKIKETIKDEVSEVMDKIKPSKEDKEKAIDVVENVADKTEEKIKETIKDIPTR